jgi:Predicted phosphohydrolases
MARATLHCCTLFSPEISRFLRVPRRPLVILISLFLILSTTINTTIFSSHNRQSVLALSTMSPHDRTNMVPAAAATAAVISNEQKPLLKIGVIADIQYAPIPDGHSYNGKPRYYRHSLVAARHAAHHFKKEKVDLVVNLGDIIDGKCQTIDEHWKREYGRGQGNNDNNDDGESHVAMMKHLDLTRYQQGDPGHYAVDDVVEALSVYEGRILHTYGNHELYNLSRQDIGRKLKIPFVKEDSGDLVGYYTHETPCKSVKFVILDSYDIAIMQRCPNHSIKRKKAEQILQENNPNFPHLENSPQGLEGIQKRFVAFNGGVDEPQLAWLRDTLQEAKRQRQKVIVLSHQPILPETSSPVCLMWNYDQVLDVLREYKDIVAASLSGHAHTCGYVRDAESGIHFRVFSAALESKDPVKTYGFLHIYENRLEIHGEGDCISDVYMLDHLDSSSNEIVR